MIKTFASFSFGCRVNQAEKEMLDRQLSAIGFQYSVDNPDIYIINTCAVTEKAEREARQLIYQTRRKWPKTKIVVTGCAATKWMNEKTAIPKADLLIDNLNKEYIASILNSKFKIQNSKLQFKIQNYKDKFLHSGRLLIKIQDGCQRFCTFCIVPYLRGKPKSIKIKDLVRTINIFTGDAREGITNDAHPPAGGEHHLGIPERQDPQIREVILTAINTQAYGYDTGETFTDLIDAIIKNTQVPRISFGSIHPWSIDNNFLRFLEKKSLERRIIKYFHIPLQSGSNKILQLMRRGYTREEFMEKLNQIDKIFPLTFFGTDIITGFLGEKESDFEDTYNFLSDSPISKFHVFRFSRREKTAAFFMAKNMKEPTPAQKTKRAKALLELSEKKYRQFLEKHIGKTFPALFLERKIGGYQEVLLNNQTPAMIKSGINLMGQIKTVRIKSIKRSFLQGIIS